MHRVLAAIWSDRRGQDIIEYALLAALVSVSAVAFVPAALNPVTVIGSKVASVLFRSAS